MKTTIATLAALLIAADSAAPAAAATQPFTVLVWNGDFDTPFVAILVKVYDWTDDTVASYTTDTSGAVSLNLIVGHDYDIVPKPPQDWTCSPTQDEFVMPDFPGWDMFVMTG